MSTHALVRDAALRQHDSLPVLVFFDIPGQDAYDPKYRDPFCFLNLQAEWSGVGTKELCVFAGADFKMLLAHIVDHSVEYSCIVLFFAGKLPNNINTVLSRMNERVPCHLCQMQNKGFQLLSYAVRRSVVAHG